MRFSPLITQLIDDLRCLPGVGPKSAQRMALHILERNREGAKKLANTIIQAVDTINQCRRCRNLTEHDICALCNNPKRDTSQLCVVESPADVLAIEAATDFNGLYFVLMGHLSPLDGVGPQQLGMDLLEARLFEEPFTEIILATNPTAEGEATAHYISEIVRPKNIRVTRIAHGVPMGGELDYVDGGTIAHAFRGRREV